MKNTRQRGICRICGQEREFCNSHLLPDGLKKLIEDFRKKAPAVHSFDLNGGGSRKWQSLPTDQQILCNECDQKLGLHDKYLIETLRDWKDAPNRLSISSVLGPPIHIHLKRSSDRLCLGIAASLLRFSISQMSPEIDLGPLQEKLAAVLMSGIPNELPVFLDMRLFGSSAEPHGKVDVTQIIRSEPLRLPGNRHVYLVELLGLDFF